MQSPIFPTVNSEHRQLNSPLFGACKVSLETLTQTLWESYFELFLLMKLSFVFLLWEKEKKNLNSYPTSRLTRFVSSTVALLPLDWLCQRRASGLCVGVRKRVDGRVSEKFELRDRHWSDQDKENARALQSIHPKAGRSLDVHIYLATSKSSWTISSSVCHQFRAVACALLQPAILDSDRKPFSVQRVLFKG